MHACARRPAVRPASAGHWPGPARHVPRARAAELGAGAGARHAGQGGPGWWLWWWGWGWGGSSLGVLQACARVCAQAGVIYMCYLPAKNRRCRACTSRPPAHPRPSLRSGTHGEVHVRARAVPVAGTRSRWVLPLRQHAVARTPCALCTSVASSSRAAKHTPFMSVAQMSRVTSIQLPKKSSTAAGARRASTLSRCTRVERCGDARGVVHTSHASAASAGCQQHWRTLATAATLAMAACTCNQTSAA